MEDSVEFNLCEKYKLGGAHRASSRRSRVLYEASRHSALSHLEHNINMVQLFIAFFYVCHFDLHSFGYHDNLLYSLLKVQLGLSVLYWLVQS